MAKRRNRPSKSKKTSGYLHGYSAAEQQRLYHQARFLESSVFEGVSYPPGSSVIEVGCGVGAQTEILLERFPTIKVRGLDASERQIQQAKKHLKKQIQSGSAAFNLGDAMDLPFPENSFDGAFVCWFLEHLKKPVAALKQIHRVLRPSAVIHCNEVLNATFYVHPYSPATLQYWFAFNDHQWNLGGDPFTGAKLANYLTAAGFQNVVTQVVVKHLDNRVPKQRAEHIQEWTEQLLSGAQELIEAGRVTPETVEGMRRELTLLKTDPDAVLFYTWVKARAQAL